MSSDSEGPVEVPKIADETEAEVLSIEPSTETMAKRVSDNSVALVVKKRKRQHTRTAVAKFKQGELLEWSDNGGKKQKSQASEILTIFCARYTRSRKAIQFERQQQLAKFYPTNLILI